MTEPSSFAFEMIAAFQPLRAISSNDGNYSDVLAGWGGRRVRDGAGQPFPEATGAEARNSAV